MRSAEVHWVFGFKQKEWLPEEFFQNILHIQTYKWTKYALFERTVSVGLQEQAKAFWRNFLKHYTHSNMQMNKVCALWKYTEWWASSRSNGLQKKFFKTIYIFKHTIDQNMHSPKVHWVVGFKQKQWLSKEVFQNTTNIQTYNWAKYALCESTRSGGLQAEVMASRRSFSKQYTYSNIQLIKICTLLKYTEWWASSRSNGFQKKFFKTLQTFKHTIEQGMRSVKVLWVVDFKQKQWVAEEFFWNIIHMQTYNWTKYALCGSTLSVWLQAERMASRRIFSKHFTYSNIQVDKICTLWKNSECWASRTSKGFLKKFFETLYTFKHANEQSMRSVKIHWVVGFKQK